MLTVDDIKKLTEVFATKEDLKQLQREVATKDDLREVMTKLDAVYRQVMARRNEESVHRQEHDDINGRLDKIESIPAIAHDLHQEP